MKGDVVALWAVEFNYRGETKLESAQWVETPSGYKAAERTGLAFRCRSLLKREEGHRTPRAAIDAARNEVELHLLHLRQELAKQTERLTSLHFLAKAYPAPSARADPNTLAHDAPDGVDDGS